jgi:hypothetical protein
MIFDFDIASRHERQLFVKSYGAASSPVITQLRRLA